MGTFAPQSVYSNNPSPQTGAGLAALASNQEAVMELPGAQAPQTIEISDNALTFSATPVSAYLFVDTEGQAAADDLEVINPVVSATDNLHDGMLLHLQAADAGRTVTVVNSSSANGIQTVSGANITLATDTWVTLQLRSGTWYETVSIKDDSLVHKTGAETISGAKTFTSAITASGGVTGNASTASKLQTARTINGVSFDGSENITIHDSEAVALDGSNLSGAAVKAVVQEWHSGANWYRVWSDGWIEQGGITSGTGSYGTKTVNLNKAFSNTNYTVLNIAQNNATASYTSSGQNASWQGTLALAGGISSKTTSTFVHASFRDMAWYACGF